MRPCAGIKLYGLDGVVMLWGGSSYFKVFLGRVDNSDSYRCACANSATGLLRSLVQPEWWLFRFVFCEPVEQCFFVSAEVPGVISRFPLFRFRLVNLQLHSYSVSWEVVIDACVELAPGPNVNRGRNSTRDIVVTPYTYKCYR